MSRAIDDLVQRQASIFTDLSQLDTPDFEFLANSTLAEDTDSSVAAMGRKLLRGIVRTQRFGTAQIMSLPASTKSTTVAAQPGFYVIELMPLLDGNFDREHVLQEPVVGWQIDAGTVTPLIVGRTVSDKWAVLTPEGTVATDEITNMLAENPKPLKEWIRWETAWQEGRIDGPESEHLVDFKGPVAKALACMMSGRPYWTGTPEELYDKLYPVKEANFASLEGWPDGPQAFTAGLEKLKRELAGTNLLFGRSDDGRLLIVRRFGEQPVGGALSGGALSSALQ